MLLRGTATRTTGTCGAWHGTTPNCSRGSGYPHNRNLQQGLRLSYLCCPYRPGNRRPCCRLRLPGGSGCPVAAGGGGAAGVPVMGFVGAVTIVVIRLIYPVIRVAGVAPDTRIPGYPVQPHPLPVLPARSWWFRSWWFRLSQGCWTCGWFRLSALSAACVRYPYNAVHGYNPHFRHIHRRTIGQRGTLIPHHPR